MKNKVNYNSIMNIVDDETFGADERIRVENEGIFLLEKTKKTNQLFFIGKCGGEVRVELTINFTQKSNGAITVYERAKLFEGSSTSSTDLDGTASKAITIAPNTTKTVNFKVRNTDEGGDYANISLTIRNTVISETDCTIAIKAKSEVLGRGFTGNATSNINAPSTVSGGKRVTFQKCDIYCSSAGTYEVHGAIRHKYNAVGGPNNALHLPITNETKTPDTLGRYNHFSGNGSIYWHPTTGPKLVRGGIRHTWATTGWERGKYGYPTSDEINIKPRIWFSDFQNGVIYWEGKTFKKPKIAKLSGNKVAIMFKKKFKELTSSNSSLKIKHVTIDSVSNTGYDFTRSKNRKVTFKITGEYESGHWYIPNPSYIITLRLAFTTDKNPDGKVSCKLLVKLDSWHIHTSGIGHSKLLKGLKDGILKGFKKPLELGKIPANVGFLSFKILKNGGIRLYFSPDSIGSTVAIVAQNKLNNL